jgi:hypothetical protein
MATVIDCSSKKVVDWFITHHKLEATSSGRSKGFTTADAGTPHSVIAGLMTSTMVINSQLWQRRRIH